MFIPKKRIACTVGHSILKNGTITSADGTNKGGVNEYKWCKEFTKILVETFKKNGIQADFICCPERKFSSANEERSYKLAIVNSGKYDLVIESHLNSFNSKAKGTETLYYPTSKNGKDIAQRVNDKLDDIFLDRDIKARGNLYILKCDPVAILNEYFFCDNREDYQKADEPHEKQLIANKVVEGVLNKTITNTTPSKPSNTNKGDVYMKTLVTYLGDADVFGAIVLAQKNKCALMKVSDYEKEKANIKVDKVIQVGGNANDTNRFETFKNVAKQL